MRYQRLIKVHMMMSQRSATHMWLCMLCGYTVLMRSMQVPTPMPKAHDHARLYSFRLPDRTGHPLID